MWTNEWINKSEAIDFFPLCFYGLLHVNGQSNFHWTEFLVSFFFFFNLFHLEKIEFTSEMLTHARPWKVLACVALKKRRTFLPFLSYSSLIWDSFSGWWEGADLTVFCLHSVHQFALSCWSDFEGSWRRGFWKGWEERRGAEGEWTQYLLHGLRGKDPVQNPVVQARLWTFIDSLPKSLFFSENT